MEKLKEGRKNSRKRFEGEWLEAIEIFGASAWGGGRRAKWSFYPCLYAAPLKYRLCNWRAPYPGERYFNGSQRLRAYTLRSASSNLLCHGISPPLSNVRHKCAAIFSIRIYPFPSSLSLPSFSRFVIEIASSSFRSLFSPTVSVRFRFLERTTMRNEIVPDDRLEMPLGKKKKEKKKESRLEYPRTRDTREIFLYPVVGTLHTSDTYISSRTKVEKDWIRRKETKKKHGAFTRVGIIVDEDFS